MTVLKGTLTIKRELPEAQVDIQASNRTFRERFGVLTPGSIRLMAVTVNIEEPTYQWSYFDDELEAWVDFSGALSKIKDWTVVPGDWNARWFRVTVKSATLKDPISARIMIDKVEEDIESLISKARHIGGEVVLSQASMKCIDVVDDIDGYLCYIERGEEGEIVNDFAVGDLAYCRVSNGSKTKYYWRLVTEVEEGYIKLSMTEKDGSGIPAAGDDIMQLGNATDTTRQSAIILSTVGIDAPSWKQYSGINSFSLKGKEITVFSKLGNRISGQTVFTAGGTNLDDHLDGVSQDILDAQQAADGKSATFFAKPAVYQIGDTWYLTKDETVNGIFYRKGTMLHAAYATGQESDWRQVIYEPDATSGVNILRNYDLRFPDFLFWGSVGATIDVDVEDLPTEFYKTGFNILADEYGFNYPILDENGNEIVM